MRVGNKKLNKNHLSSTIRVFRPIAKRKVKCMANQTHSLAHTKWMCKYHIVFTPKYRRKAIYGELRKDIREYIRILCKYKGVEIIEGHMMIDHVHLLLSIPPKVFCKSASPLYFSFVKILMIVEVGHVFLPEGDGN